MQSKKIYDKRLSNMPFFLLHVLSLEQAWADREGRGITLYFAKISSSHQAEKQLVRVGWGPKSSSNMCLEHRLKLSLSYSDLCEQDDM